MNVSRKVSLIALLTAVSVATDYLLVGVPNVKLMDGLVFLGANLFGFEVGGSSCHLELACIWNNQPLRLSHPRVTT